MPLAFRAAHKEQRAVVFHDLRLRIVLAADNQRGRFFPTTVTHRPSTGKDLLLLMAVLLVRVRRGAVNIKEHLSVAADGWPPFVTLRADLFQPLRFAPTPTLCMYYIQIITARSRCLRREIDTQRVP